MNCKKCNRELRIEPRKVDVDKNNLPIYHRFAYCDSCMIFFDLDKPEEKKETVSGKSMVREESPKEQSFFGFAGLILSFLSYKSLFLAILSFVFCIIAINSKKHKKTFGKIGLFICIPLTLLGSLSFFLENSKETTQSQIAENVYTEKIELMPEYKESCVEYDYKEVLRNIDDYVGKRIKLTVRVSSVHEEGFINNVKYYLAYGDEDENGSYYDNLYGIFDERENDPFKILEDDIIIVYGEISGSANTTSAIVSSQEVICVDMKYVELAPK